MVRKAKCFMVSCHAKSCIIQTQFIQSFNQLITTCVCNTTFSRKAALRLLILVISWEVSHACHRGPALPKKCSNLNWLELVSLRIPAIHDAKFHQNVLRIHDTFSSENNRERNIRSLLTQREYTTYQKSEQNVKDSCFWASCIAGILNNATNGLKIF